METIVTNVEDVAKPDQIVSGTAGTGLKNISWNVITRGLVVVDIGDLDIISCTNLRWIWCLQRQIARFKERKKARTITYPVFLQRGGMKLAPPSKTTYSGNLIIPSAQRQDRLYVQINKKINRQNQQVTVHKMRGWCWMTGSKSTSMTETPLFLVPQAVTQLIRERDEKVYRTSVRWTHFHHYNMSVRTRSLPKELRPVRESLPDFSGEAEGMA